ncbi:uncharacterized protein LOC125779239 [Bactrocera dorsalis]|uniref:Uncharacterized protein LOC125779239 n=1 Tax=Bactrocera dorsalis TaxID=27457 RepID=A0ABM3K2X9_BACDO|nr:uncharacterized protein LOC125779239 [Bactrocera dorsalis]
MNVESRISTIKKYGYCYNCLAISHSYKNCVSKFSCRKCHKKHNTLIHRESSFRPESTPEIPNVTSSNPENASSTALPTQSTNTNRQAYTTTIQSTKSSTQDPPNPSRKQIILGTAMVQIEHNGQRYSARALIDSGSEATFISRRLQRSLDIPTHSVSAQVTGLNNAVSATPTNICEITLCSPLNANYKLSAQAFILNSLTDNLPSYPIDPKQCLKNLGFTLADTQFHKPRPVDILIGSDIYPSILLNGVKRNILGSLLAQETEFGWILSGPITQPSQNSAIVSFHNKVNPESLLTRFWEVEEIPKESVVSKSDQICEEIFQKTTRRNPDGRYIVTLPFKEPDNIDIGQSRHIALAQFLRNERALLKKPEVKAEYDKAIMEYLELGQMKKVEYDPSGKATQYYLPHHAVIKPDRITTKLRVVFNASCPTSNHKSLNDVLHIGPTLQKDLVILITNWRLFQFVFNADIQKMYRQILVDPKHTRFQRILFRKSPEDTIEDFELQTVTFGINCAPYLAIRTLMKLADDIEETHPLAAKILRQEMYVDDVLAGTHDLTTAKSARDELISALKTPGFALRKWTSNDPHILKGLPQDHLLETETLNLSEPENTKTLGIRWNSKKDSFFFLVNPMEKKPAYTKREVLSAIAKLFDPAGWLSPIIITAKIIMQQIWLDKTDWDESLKPLTLHRWNSFVKDYDNINKIEIPSHQNISWHFNPPGAPHMGGLWEAGVKSLKTHLKKIAKLQKFTFEEFATLLTRIESCLNSRPISPISDDSTSLEPLTPGHFLIGTPLLTPAEPNLEDANLSIVNRWQKLKILYQHICKRWKEEYLKELHKRYKWKYPHRNVEVNDLVVIRNDNTSPNEWKLGRIQKVFPGLDHKTRVVEIRTAQGTVTRPITKIVILNTE